MSCDIVIPYVDSNDSEWQIEFNKANAGRLYTARFRSWDTLNYLFRGIELYMPFVNNIFLIVSQESQVPDWLNRSQVNIVYHKDFIPEEFLPVFNSCTIENFLGNISGLSEHIIYFNDDLFPINTFKETDFFIDDKPVLTFSASPFSSLIFLNQCRAGLDVITDLVGQARLPYNMIILPEHNALPMLKSTLEKVLLECQDRIKSSISTFRDSKNINQYIYHYYQFFSHNYFDDSYIYTYHEIQDDMSLLRRIVLESNTIKLLCLNDNYNLDDYEYRHDQVLNIFNTKFPNKCKYEI